MFGPHFNIVFLGGKGGVSWVYRALGGSILKLNIQRAFFLTFLSKIVEQNSKGKKWCAKTRISALVYRVSRLATLLLTIICCYSGLSHREIFCPFSIPWPCKCLERSLLFWTEIPPRTRRSSNIINPSKSEQLQAKVCLKRAPVLYEKYKKLHGVPLRISSVT